jgi:hypothetical protein
MLSEREVSAMKEKLAPQLLSEPGVTGLFVERDDQGEWVLVIGYDGQYPDVPARLRERTQGYSVKFDLRGPFYKLSTKSARSTQE